MNDQKVGISAISTYVPPYRVDLEEWCTWTNQSWEKIKHVIGTGFRMMGPNQTIYTMAANAVLDLILSHKVSPSEIGFLALGTESSTDNSAGSIIIKGMVNKELKRRSIEPISNNCEVPEYKQACLSGIYALKNAVRFIKTDAPRLKGIVVCSDIALYQLGASGEPTQGAGAVAVLIESNPKIAEVKTSEAGSASDYRHLDFRKPIQYRAKQANGHSDFDLELPIFNGKYSSSCYVDGTLNAMDDMSSKNSGHLANHLKGTKAIFMHRPFKKMPITAFSIAYLYALAHGDKIDHEELIKYVNLSNLDENEILEELLNKPNVSDFPDSDINREALPLTTELVKIIHSESDFQKNVISKLRFGSELTMEMGNIYSGSVFVWLSAGLEDALNCEVDLSNEEALMIGYGSGDAAEVIPIIFVKGWQKSAKITPFSSAFKSHINLTHEQYLKLRSEKTTNGIDYDLRNEFVVRKIGTEERVDFQDAGIEYYEFLN